MGAIGAYGLTIPINITDNQMNSLVDVSYVYHSSRTYDSMMNTTFKKLDSSVLVPATRESGDQNFDSVLDGMYNLRLPVSEFSKKGFYTVYIKPKEIKAKIADVGTLSAFPEVSGIIIDTSKIEDSNTMNWALSNNRLVGYRVIFISNGREDYYRIITSNNKCEPVISKGTTSTEKNYTYVYDDASLYTFVTLSPSSTAPFNTNASPYMGYPNQDILLVNTMFEPIQIDIEMVDHDADTISYMLEGSQLRDLDNGLVTTYNENNEIYHQSEHFTLKDQYTGEPVYEVKEKKNNNIDFSQTISDKIS